MSEEFLTVAEAAEKLSVSPRTIQRYCKQSRLNYKWIQGNRHKELRIIPPISMEDLPGVRKKNVLSAFDFVTKNDFRDSNKNLQRLLSDKDSRIDKLEHEITHLKSIIPDSAVPGAPLPQTPAKHDPGLLKMADSFLHDLGKVRPAERKLILKMAKELKTHSEFLHKLGMDKQSEDDSELE